MRYNPKIKYLINNWKKLSKSERRGLAKNISWYDVSAYDEGLPLDFIIAFESYINFTVLSLYGKVSEEVLDYLKYSENSGLILASILSQNKYSEEYLLNNIEYFIKYSNVLLEYQDLSPTNRLKIQSLAELIG